MDVFFEVQNGYKFTIELGYWDTVLEIKQKIEKYQKIPASKQTLYFNGKILQDHLDIDKCNIFVDSHIHVFVSSSSPNCYPIHRIEVTKETEQPPTTDSLERTVPVTVPVVQKTKLINDQDSSMEVKSNQNKNGQVKGTEQSPPLDSTEEVINIQDPSLSVKTKNSDQVSSARGRKMVVNVSPYLGESEAKNFVCVNRRDNVRELRKHLVLFQEKGRLNLPQQGYFLTHQKGVIDEERSYSWNGINPNDTIKIYPRDVTGGS